MTIKRINVMKITILTVSYNAADTLGDAMESVRLQKREDVELEYIVVDGGSDDGTVEMLRSEECRMRDAGVDFRWVSEHDNGLYDAMNKGLRLATGDVIGIVNADDMMASDSVIQCVAHKYAVNPELEFLYSDVRFVDRDVRLAELRNAKTRRYICPIFWHPWMLTFGYAPPHPGQYIRKSCFEKWGLYKPNYRIGADYEMNVRFVRKQMAKRAYLRQCSVAMRLGGASTKKGAAGSFIGNNYDVINANRENGYKSSRLLILGKLPIKAIEVIVPKVFPYIGA